MIRRREAIPPPPLRRSTPGPSAGAAAADKAAFLDHIHAFRGLAIFFIVAGHAVISFDWSDDSHLGRLLSIVFQNGTVYFVFIAGYLFQHLLGKYDYARYLKSKARHVILPYLLMSTPAVCYFVFVVRRWGLDASFYEQSVAVEILDFFLTGRHITTYWFIPMIVAFYLAAPLFVALDRREKSYWLLPLALALSLQVQRGQSLALNCVHFFSVYWLGMFCSHYRSVVARAVSRFRPLLWLLALACIVSQLEWAPEARALNLVQKLAFCGLFLDLLAHCGRRTGRCLSVFADLSFGIYFVHPYVMFALQHCPRGLRDDSFLCSGAGCLGEGDLFVYSVYLATVLACSAALVILAQKAFGRHSRMILGS